MHSGVLEQVFCHLCHHCTTAILRAHSVAGDGSFSDSMVKEEMDEMKACENDDDYTFLLRQLCNDGYMPSGPHLKRDPENNDWQRASSTRVVHNPPADSGQYD